MLRATSRYIDEFAGIYLLEGEILAELRPLEPLTEDEEAHLMRSAPANFEVVDEKAKGNRPRLELMAQRCVEHRSQAGRVEGQTGTLSATGAQRRQQAEHG